MMRKLLLTALAASVVALLLVPGNEDVDLTQRLAAPSFTSPLGADHLGRDLLTRLAGGARGAFTVVALASAIALVLGVLLAAAITGLRGPAGLAIRRACDFMLAVPSLILALLVAAFVGLTPVTGALALGAHGAAATALFAAGLFSTAHAATHVRAAEALGGTQFHILRRHVIPAALPTLLTAQSYDTARFLLAWSALTFLGLGADTSRPDWGAMVWEYRLFLFDHPRLVLAPVAAIAATATIFSLLGDREPDFLSGEQ